MLFTRLTRVAACAGAWADGDPAPLDLGQSEGSTPPIGFIDAPTGAPQPPQNLTSSRKGLPH